MIPNSVRFWVYLTVLIPSIAFSVFVLCCLLGDRALHRALHNHVVIVILLVGLIYEATNFPWMLYFYRSEGVWERSLTFCTVSAYIEWVATISQVMLFAWANVQRHILIFHEKWVSTKARRFFCHYLVIVSLIVYCLMFYFLTILFPSCENLHDTSAAYCLINCAFDNYSLYLYDAIIHQTAPVVIILLFSVLLLGRVVWQKQRIHQAIHWRQHRKMTVQVLSITILYLVFELPVTVVYSVARFAPFNDWMVEILDVSIFLCYFPFLLLPFVCGLSSTEVRARLKTILQPHQRVGHITLPMKTRDNPNMDVAAQGSL